MTLEQKKIEIPKEAISWGLTEEEYLDAVNILGRKPNLTELGMISAMWSEHCSYKSSRVHLSKFPTTGKNVLEGPGENAGVIDIGEGLACVFKVESHNHPSYIEPYQGAATGVGGILRDVFTMGARPVASLNSLRFGEVGQPRMQHLLRGVVAGIGDYGNCVGIPTIGGEVTFHHSFNGNILVNAFTLGLVKSHSYFKGNAKGPGNPIFYVGSRTGRDGIHGATMASESFNTDDEEAQEKRPTVQVGDPFTEKLLLEACLELMEKEAIVGIQDMGAAGLTSSSFEMAGRAGTGVRLDLDKVPCREEGMTPYELMLSESQERMLLVAKKGKENLIKDIFQKWGLQASQIGEVTTDGNVTLSFHGKEVAKLPSLPLSNHAPKLNRPMEKPKYLEDVQNYKFDGEAPPDMEGCLVKLLSSPNLCSKAWVYEQYDQSVRTNTIQGPGGDAAVIRIKESKEEKGLAMTSDCNPRYCYLDPSLGGEHAVAEAARNLACVGAKPIGLTNCLNFGNPENPEIMWQFSKAIEGLSRACNELDVPVVSGNVSFYNETDGTGIFPTPTVVMVGLLSDVNKTCGISFQKIGDSIFLLGPLEGQLEASEYLSLIHNIEKGKPSKIDWVLEKNIHEVCREGIQKGIFHSVHDLSEGGLLLALAESSLESQNQSLGAQVNLKEYQEKLPIDRLWFGEGPSRVLVSLPEENISQFKELTKKNRISFLPIGRVIEEKLAFTDNENHHEIPLKDLYSKWRYSLDHFAKTGKFNEVNL